jgi:hypothetical protein
MDPGEQQHVDSRQQRRDATGSGSFTITVAVLSHSTPNRTGKVKLWDPFPTTDLQVGLTVNQNH